MYCFTYLSIIYSIFGKVNVSKAKEVLWSHISSAIRPFETIVTLSKDTEGANDTDNGVISPDMCFISVC